MWFLALLLASTLAGCHSNEEPPPCPGSEVVYPCSCESDQFLTSVNCEGLNGLTKLQPVLKNTAGYNLSFAFWRSNLGAIPSDFFEGHRSVNLHFENCKIHSFGEKPFSGLENTLKTIYIYGSVDKRRKDLTTFRLGHLNKLETLSFMANDIVRLGNDWFADGPESVRDLNLEANDIEELGDRAFAMLPNVEEIWLGDNRFKVVSRSMFPRPANKLRLLEMSFDGIEELPVDMFEDFPSLRTVNLMGNKLHTISEQIWGQIWPQLEEVYVDRMERFVCTNEIKWIYQQRLPRILTGKCGYGNDLYKKELSELKLEDFQ